MKGELDILIKEAQREEKYFKNYLDYAKRIKRIAEKILGKIEVFVFGSCLKKDEIPQDIDILIISPKLKTTKEKSEVRAKIWQKIKIFSPLEIHLVTPSEYKNWYKNFIDKKIRIF
jgi:predicted nucleotidyltransferase